MKKAILHVAHKNFSSKIFTLLIGNIIGLALQAQTVVNQNEDTTNFIRCAQMEYENYRRTQDPDFNKKRDEMEKTIQEGVAKIEQLKLSDNTQAYGQYTIPIVVHVVWHTQTENVSDANIHKVIDQLNKDWSRTNTDASNTPSVWQSLAANMGIQFCLVTKDPNGNSTNGIIRKQTSMTSWDGTNVNISVQEAADDGDDPWNVNKYLNIWICNFSGGFLGYAEMPPISSIYGVVIDYCNVNGSCPPFNMGRTLSHEVGHALGLYHIWGDDGGSCNGSDQVNDTPNQANQSSHSCYNFPKTDACSPSSPGVMFMNYMDYATDACYNMFTTGQKNRCQSTISNYLMSIANSAATLCGPATGTGNSNTNELSMGDMITVFPNPSNGTIFVGVNGFEMANVSVRIYNVLGETVSQISDKITLPTTFKCDVADQVNGVYFVEVKSDKGSSIKKFVLDK